MQNMKKSNYVFCTYMYKGVKTIYGKTKNIFN